MPHHKITPADIERARADFEANEPRDLFYRAATELVSLALQGKTSLSVADALSVLLQTWNKAYFRFHRFGQMHFADIENLWQKHQKTLARYRKLTIDNLHCKEQPTVSQLFQAFENVLGPVGAAKALHLLAPKLFPLWDRHIAKAYDLPLGKGGSNGDRYWRFMLIAQGQCLELSRQDPPCQNCLKSIDEFNYGKYTKGWWRESTVAELRVEADASNPGNS